MINTERRTASTNRLSKKNQLIIFAIHFVIMLLVYGRLLQPHYSPDFFSVHVNGASELPHHIRNGRILYGLILCVVEYLGLGVTTYTTAYTLLFICVASYCVMRVCTALCNMANCDDMKIVIAVSLALLNSVINISMTEWFLFVECMLMYSLALLFSTVGAMVFAQRQSSLLRKILISFAAVFVSVNCYQAALSWYFTLSLLFVLMGSGWKFNKAMVVECVAAIMIAAVNSLLNQLIVRIAATSPYVGYMGRHATLSVADVIANVVKSIPIQLRFLHSGFSLMPRYFLFAAFSLGAMMVSIAVYQKYRDEVWVGRLILLALVLCAGYAFVYLPHFVSSYMDIAPRSVLGIFMLLALMLALTLLWGKQWMRWLALCCSVVVLVITHLSISHIIDDHLLTSQRDYAEAQDIVCAIDEYEQRSGETVREICVIKDAKPSYYYPEVTTGVKDINLRQIYIDWEQVNILTALSGRSFVHKYVSAEDEYAIVQGRNWDELNLDEQLIFQGMTLYIIAF